MAFKDHPLSSLQSKCGKLLIGKKEMTRKWEDEPFPFTELYNGNILQVISNDFQSHPGFNTRSNPEASGGAYLWDADTCKRRTDETRKSGAPMISFWFPLHLYSQQTRILRLTVALPWDIREEADSMPAHTSFLSCLTFSILLIAKKSADCLRIVAIATAKISCVILAWAVPGFSGRKQYCKETLSVTSGESIVMGGGRNWKNLHASPLWKISSSGQGPPRDIWRQHGEEPCKTTRACTWYRIARNCFGYISPSQKIQNPKVFFSTCKKAFFIICLKTLYNLLLYSRQWI